MKSVFTRTAIIIVITGLFAQAFFVARQAAVSQTADVPLLTENATTTPPVVSPPKEPEPITESAAPEVSPAQEPEKPTEKQAQIEQKPIEEKAAEVKVEEPPSAEPEPAPQPEPTPEPEPEPTPPTPPPTSPEELSVIGAEAGLTQEGAPQTVMVPQEDETITVVAKIAEEAPTKSNRDGLSIVKGDIAARPEEVLFFEEQGSRKEIIELSELIKKEEDQAANVEIVQGGEAVVLQEIRERADTESGVAVNVEDIIVKKKEEGLLRKLADAIFGGEKDNQQEERIQIEVTSNGEVKLVAAENVEGDEKLEIEYSYGSYTKSFDVSFAPMTLEASFAIASLSSEEVEQAVKNLEQLGQQQQQPPAPPAETPAPLEVEEVPVEVPAPPVEEIIVPVELPDQGAVQGARIQNFYSFLPLRNTARAQSGFQTVQAFQVKLKAATVKGEQTFQILPNGLVYLYHGSSIEAISRPRFQYLQGSGWSDFTITNASVGTSTTEETATHLIQYATEEGDTVALKYDFGLINNAILKKQTWTISGDKIVRVVWETLFRAGSGAQKELASTSSVSSPSEGGESGGSRTRLYGDIVIDTSDYLGEVEIEEDAANNIVRVYFEKDGAQAPLTIDPSFSVVTGDQFVEVATPDFQSPGSTNGWKIRFNRLVGGGIDQYFHNAVDNGATNIASSTKPLFNLAYTNSAIKDLSQTQAHSMQVVERGATRLRVQSLVSIGNDELTITYTVYLAGQIYIDIQNVLQDGSIAAQQGVFQLNQSYAGYQSGFGVHDNGTNSVAIDGTQADTAFAPFFAGDVAGVSESQSEQEDYIQVALGTGTQAMYANGNTATNQFLLSLRGAEGDEAISVVLPKLAADYQSPDPLTPFTIGTFQGYNQKEGAYEMMAIEDKIKFAIDGSTATRYYPIFKISNWQNANLAAVYAELDNGEIKQDLDYILTFVNSDPNTHILIFQYLQPLTDVRTFYIDPTCTSNATGNWSAAGTWQSCDPNTTDSVTIASGHTVTINQNVTVDTIYIQQGKLTFDTTARTLTINEDGVSNTGLIQVGNAAGSNDATFECVGPTSGSHTIKLVTNTGTNPSVGIEVETDGFLNIQGTSAANQNCIIKNDGVTTGGTKNGYIYLKDGSETIIKNADISYMGANVANKYGITANDIDGNVTNEGLVIEGSVIHDGYYGLAINAGSKFIMVRNSTFHTISATAIYSFESILVSTNVSHIFAYNTMYSITNGHGVFLDGDKGSMIIGNAIKGSNVSGTFGIRGGNTCSGCNAGSYIENNSLEGNDSGIGGTPLTIRNNLITNNTYAVINIINHSIASVVYENNYRFGGSTSCFKGGNNCDASFTWSANSGTNPNYVNTTGGNADFLYLQANSGALGVGADFFNSSDTTPCQDSAGARTLACVNVGGRLGYVVNDQEGAGAGTADDKFNWLQSAHDDATGEVLSAGDTVTAYANNVTTATIVANISAVGTIGTAYYQVKFDIADATITASDQHEGFYAYFTSGANRGRQYVIIDSVKAATNTMTILSPQANTTFTAGDGFRVVDRVYAREAGGSNCTGTTENLCLTKDGDTTNGAITWTTNGTVVLDAASANNTVAIYLNAADSNVINSFIARGGASYGIQVSNSNYNVVRNNTVVRNPVGVYADSAATTNVFHNNDISLNTDDGMRFDTATTVNNLVVANTVYSNTGNGIEVNTGASETIIGNILYSNTQAAIRLASGGNFVYHNTVNSNSADGISVASGTGNIVKNNLLTNQSAGWGINDAGTSSVISYNYYYLNNSGTCTGSGCGTSAGTENPNYISTANGNADFMYLDSDESTSAGPLGAGVQLWGASPAQSGIINVGVRDGYVKNTTDDEEFNFLQDAHDDASGTKSLGSGDTVIAYATNYFSDTVSSVTRTGGDFIRLNIVTTANVAAANDYVGAYAYFTSGTNRGRFFRVAASATGSPDTITIYTAGVNTGFNPGDGFTIVDRVYARDSGESTNCTGTENLCITKAGSGGASVITWNTSGRVIIDAGNTRTYGIDITGGDYNVLDGFTVLNAVTGGDGIRLTNVNNSRYVNLTVARNAAMGINDGSGNQDNVFETNTVFSNTSHGLGSVNQSFVSGNTVYGNSGRGIDITANSTVYNNLLAGNANSIFVAGAGNMIRANRIVRDTVDGVVLSGAANNAKITNNMIAGNTSDGIDGSAYLGTGSTLRNNLIMNHGIGINSVGSGITSNFNYLYNTTQVSGGVSEGASSIPASGSGAGTDPDFVAETNGSGTATGGSTTTLVDTGKTWTINQWANSVLHITGGTGANQWGFILGNTATTLYVTPAFGTATASGSVYEITDFYLVSTSGTTPLGGGAKHDGTTGSAGVNMGARLEYVSNSDGTRNNGLQYAHDAGATGAGDTLTVYGVEELTSGTVSSAADSGPYVTLTLSTDSIAANDDYIGMYVYMTAGTNIGKYYLIIDSATVAGPADTIAINTAATTGFAANDTFKVVDRVYTTTGWTSGATTANARFTKDGASGSPITWNAVANNTVLIDAAGKTYAFYGDTDGTNGLKYNNFQTAGTFTFVNVSNGANLYQGGFGFNTTSVVHDHVNWGGTTDAYTIFSGQYISKIIDMTQADPVYGKLVWGQTVTSGTSDIVMHTRSTDTANGSDIGTKTFVGPDGTTNTQYTTEAGEDIADAHNGHQYFQYRATLTTNSTNTLPELTSASVSQEAELISSWFNTESSASLFNDLTWTESNGSGGAIPSGTDVRVQVRTAPDSSGAPGSATAWCGPDDGNANSCTSTTYFTTPSGVGEEIDNILRVSDPVGDDVSDQWVQYKIIFIQPGNSKPYLEDISLQYVINTAPTLSVTSASQGSDGVATVAYSISDAEEAGEDGAVTVGLYYERGGTLSANITTTTQNTVTVSDASVFPASGTILIENEVMTYSGKSGNVLQSVTRGAESSKASTHTSGAGVIVWIKATTVSGNVGSVTGVTATAAAKSISWTPKTDINGVYDATHSVRVIGHDGNAANQIGGGTSADFVLDTKDPVVDSFTIDASANPGVTDVTATLTITKTEDSTVTMSIANATESVGTTYVAFASPTTWSLDTVTTTQKTVYLKLKDAKGNTSTTASAKTPVTPASLSVVDTSNVGTGDYRLFLSWKKAEATDVPAFSSYKVYRKTGSGGAYSGSGTFTLIATINAINTNYFINTNLDATNPITQAVQYDYYVITTSTDSNVSYRSNGICGIPNGAADCSEGGGGDDNTAPTIIFTESSGEGTPSNSRVTITFQTYDLPASPGTVRDAKIDYGTASGSFTFSQGIPTATSGTSAAAPTSRAVTLEGLSGSTTYYYRITVRDAAGNLAIDDKNGTGGYTFTTTNEPGSIISNVQSILINSTTVKITWTTDKVASSQVIYATNSALTGSTSYPASPSDSDTNHEVQITGLTAGRTYYYKARSVDANNNTSDSAVYNFTTADTAAPVISGVSSTNITHNSATVTFTTNEVASSSVNYGTSISYGQTSSNGNLNTTHVFNITGLSPETVYYYKVNATDAGSNASSSDNSGAGYTFTTATAPNAVLSNVRAVYVSATAVDIKWDTTIAASSQVSYGTASDLAGAVNQPTTPSNSATSHTISLSGLSQATRYYYRAISGSNQSPIYNFLTGDTTAPTITSISAVYNDKTAVISWTTNEQATSQVEYGITDAYGSSTTLDSLLTLTHAVTLTNLTPATTYYYRVKSQDGLQNASASAIQSFTTNAGVSAGTTTEDAAAPTITNITTLVSDVTAVVSWTTNKDATSQVEYGASASYGSSSTLQTSVTKDHIVRLTDLTPSTTYHFRVKSQDSIGNLAISGDQTFTTNAGKFKYESQTTGGGGVAALVIDKRDSTPAEIINFSITDVDEESVGLNWSTNEPSVTLAGYGTRSINDVAGKKESIDSRLTSHALTIKELTPGTEYRVQPFAIDAGGNVTQGTIVTFTTRGIKPPETVEAEKLEEEEEKKEEEKPIDIIEEEELISEEGKVILSEEFERFIKKLEVYLGPPIIVGITVSDITDSSATISWKTTVPSASILDYGTSESYGELTRLLQFDQDHRVTLNGLSEDTVYHFRIKGVTESGQLVATQDLVFKTTEVGKVVNFSVNDIQERSVIVSWKSNVPMTSEVEFGVVGEETLQRQGKDALATTHKLLITGLKEKTKYRIRVVSRDSGAQLITNEFTEFTTSIDDRPPVISDIEAEGLLTKRDNVRVIVSWQTDEPGTSQVFYEAGVERGRKLSQQTVKDENFTTDHTVIINDFQSGTLYQLRAESFDRAGNVGTSEDYTIITPKKEENIIDIIVTEFQDAFGFLKR